MQDYMERAVALDPLLRAAGPGADPGREGRRADCRRARRPAGSVRLAISQYLQPGDALTIDLDAATDRLVGLGVNTYLDKPDETVTLAVQMNDAARRRDATPPRRRSRPRPRTSPS